MSIRAVEAAMGRIPFDRAIRNVLLADVMTGQIRRVDIGLSGDTIAYVGPWQKDHRALETIDGEGRFAVPGLIDSHMHIESSMMTPVNFARAVLPMGTTSVAADPHEIGNVMGVEGVRFLCRQAEGLPLHVQVMAPSTIPSAPGFETSGADVDAREVTRMLDIPGVLGLGEVMDFNGVVAGEEKMARIIQAAKDRGVVLDGHVPTLQGRELQAFAASGIDCDHTYMDPRIVMEKLRCGMCVQIQERFLTPQLMDFLNSLPVQNRVMLATDDVPISRLAAKGHLGGMASRAVAMGLDPVKALRYVTINAADRLRLYDRGAIVPGRKGDILLLEGALEKFQPHLVLSDGVPVARDGKMLVPLEDRPVPDAAYHTMRLAPVTGEDFAIPCPGAGAVVNLIRQDGKTSRTVLEEGRCRAEGGKLLQGPYGKMAVFERHTGTGGRSLGLLSNMEGFHGALATTYAHDCHNLTVYSSNDDDAVLAANTLIGLGGGVAAVQDGEVLCAIPLPIAGILCGEEMAPLAEKFRRLDEAAARIGLNHQEPLTFLTLMPLAVSPQVKLTDRGLVDVMTKSFLPLIVRPLTETEAAL